jgi:hypothetical protein
MSSSSGTRRLLDPRLRILIENNVKKNHRSFIVLVGDRSRDRVRFRPISLESTLKERVFSDPRALLSSITCSGQT